MRGTGSSFCFGLLLGLSVRNVLTAEFAVFFEFHSVGVVALVLHGGVVAAFAGGASHRDY